MVETMKNIFRSHTCQILAIVSILTLPAPAWAEERPAGLGPRHISGKFFSLSDSDFYGSTFSGALGRGIAVVTFGIELKRRGFATLPVGVHSGLTRTRKDETKTMQTWFTKIGDWLMELGNRIIVPLTTSIFLALGGFVLFKYILRVRDLSGRWKFTVFYKDTAYSKFEGMEVTYQALLIQEDRKLSGSGEKLSDRGPIQDAKNYVGKDRTKIQIVGNIRHNFFSRDEIVFHYKEEGELRESSTTHRLRQCGQDTMSGRFCTTIANTSGPVRWQRSASGIDNEPVATREVD